MKFCNFNRNSPQRQAIISKGHCLGEKNNFWYVNDDERAKTWSVYIVHSVSCSTMN